MTPVWEEGGAGCLKLSFELRGRREEAFGADVRQSLASQNRSGATLNPGVLS